MNAKLPFDQTDWGVLSIDVAAIVGSFADDGHITKFAIDRFGSTTRTTVALGIGNTLERAPCAFALVTGGC